MNITIFSLESFALSLAMPIRGAYRPTGELVWSPDSAGRLSPSVLTPTAAVFSSSDLLEKSFVIITCPSNLKRLDKHGRGYRQQIETEHTLEIMRVDSMCQSGTKGSGDYGACCYS